MPFFFPSIIPRVERDRLVDRLLSAMDGVHHKLKKREGAAPCERTADDLFNTANGWLSEHIRGAHRLFAEWWREHKPVLTDADVNRTERQIKEICDQLLEQTNRAYDGYRGPAGIGSDKEAEHKRGLRDTASTLADVWIDDVLDGVTENKQTAGYVAVSSTASPEQTKPRSPRNRRQSSKAGNRLKAEAARVLVHQYIRDKCDGKWRGTLIELGEALKRDKGFERSDSSLSRDLKGTTLWERPDRNAPHRTFHRKGEREAVARENGPADLSKLDAFTMPDENPIS